MSHILSALQAIKSLGDLSLPRIPVTEAPHPPSKLPPVLKAPTHTIIQHRPLLVSEELQPSLLAYLKDGLHASTLAPEGRVGAPLAYGRRAVQHVNIDTVPSLIGILNASLFAALNELLWEESPRNQGGLAERNYCIAGDGSIALNIGTRQVACVEIETEDTSDSATVELVISLVSSQAVFFDADLNAFTANPAALLQLADYPYPKAISLLNQAWARFVSLPVDWVVLTTHERSIIFHRVRDSIEVSNVVCREGCSNDDDLCASAVTLFLALAVMPNSAFNASCTSQAQALKHSHTEACPPAPAPALSSISRIEPSLPKTDPSTTKANGVFQLHSPTRTPPPTPQPMNGASGEATITMPFSQLGSISMHLDTTNATDSSGINYVGALFTSALRCIEFRGPLHADLVLAKEAVPHIVRDAAGKANRSQTFIIEDRVGQGAIWNGFKCKASGASKASILKVSWLSAYPLADGDPDQRQVRTHIAKEIAAHQRLNGLKCVPRLLGVWGGLGAPDADGRGGDEYWAVEVEDAGFPLEPVHYTDAQKQAVLSAYEALHGAGIMHNDVKSVHWLFLDGQVQLVDFSHAADLEPLEEHHRHDLCLNEMGAVRDELDAMAPGWTKYPYKLRVEASPETPKLPIALSRNPSVKRALSRANSANRARAPSMTTAHP